MVKTADNQWFMRFLRAISIERPYHILRFMLKSDREYSVIMKEKSGRLKETGTTMRLVVPSD